MQFNRGAPAPTGSPTPRAKKLPLPRRLLFLSLIVAGLVALTELACFIGLVIVDDGFSFARLHHEQEQVPSITLHKLGGESVFHPYLGFTCNPEVDRRTIAKTPAEKRIPVNDFGFLDFTPPIHKRSPDKFIVGIVGGSVAWFVSAEGAEALTRVLRESPRLRDKEIVLVRIALPAYKQPQQLLTLSYFLSLGAEFDAIVNIDGFNEIRTHALGNGATGIFPPYPHAWAIRMERLDDPKMVGIVYRHLAYQATRSAWARFFRDLPFRYSCTANFIWKCRDRSLERTIVEDSIAISESAAQRGRSYQITGPKLAFDNDDELYDYLASYWKQCSLQLARLCAGNGILYVHALQPNQYLPGTKPISTEEQEGGALSQAGYADSVSKGYPRLIEKGKELSVEGVRFLDLTRLFAEHPEPIYNDNCCHYNPQGNELVAQAVARAIVAALE
jgi:hypothetical protein